MPGVCLCLHACMHVCICFDQQDEIPNDYWWVIRPDLSDTVSAVEIKKLH